MGSRPPDPALLATWLVVPVPTPLALQRLPQRGDEVDDLMSLLMDHAEPDPPQCPTGLRRAVAEAIAQASLGDNHLWQDLQLPSRAELSALFETHFPRLAARNTQNMKWKKFLYKQLCEREEIFVCKSPSCAVCSDYAQCFGPENT
ncbi:nitrogen fixation protein NifQ [Roseateles cellulosilyticus]|uniref:nitrogen fixation protein NifQ n=1 Tax=Pelomonas cellulosilytica TaxID=2906762 RepID=UPI0032C24616